jgi:hypothetical protein
MSEELDLTGAKWIPQNEVYLITIKESIEENFPNSNIDQDLKDHGMNLEDLLEKDNLDFFLKKMSEKYPEA